MAYVKPQDVTSPKSHWRLIEVLYDGGDSGRSDSGGWVCCRRAVGAQRR